MPTGQTCLPPLTGALREEDVREDAFTLCSCDLQVKLDSSCQAKIHAGPGRIKNNAPGATQDPEVKFIFDMDLSMGGNVPLHAGRRCAGNPSRPFHETV